VGASVVLGGGTLVMAWEDLSLCGLQCDACGVECDGVQLCGGGVPAAISYPFVRITPAPSD